MCRLYFIYLKVETYDMLILQLALMFMSEDQSIFRSLDPKIPAFLCWECLRLNDSYAEDIHSFNTSFFPAAVYNGTKTNRYITK